MLRRFAVPSILAILLLSACGKSVSPAEAARARHLAELKKIADECGVPASTFRLVGEDGVTFQVPPESQYRNVECALAKLKNSDLRLGFVGNEAFEPGNSR